MATEIVRRNVIVEYISVDNKFKKNQEDIAKGMTKFDKTLQSVKGNLLALATVGTVIAVFKNINRVVSEFETSLKQLESLTGLSGDSIDELGQRAIEMSTRFGTSASDIVDGFAKVGSAAPQLLDNADALASVTEQADILSKAAGISLDDAIGALTKSMNQYGIEASDAAKLTDILATSQQKGTARITSLTESLKNVGSVAAAQNISFENTNVLLQALAKGGLEGAEAGTKLRGVLLGLANTGRDELNPATQDFNDILKVLGKEITSVNAAQKIFGKENAAAALTLIKQADTVKTLTDNLFESNNALEQASINTDTAAEAWSRATTKWEALVLSVESGSGILSSTSKQIANDAGSILDGFRLLNEGVVRNFNDFIAVTSGTIEQREKAIARLQKLAATPETGRRLGQGFSSASEDIKVFQSQIKILSNQIKNELEPGTESYNFALEDLKFAQDKLADAQKRYNAESQETIESDTKKANTLAELKRQLKEAKAARDEITISDTGALKANENLIVGLQKRIKSLSITAKKTKEVKEEIEDATDEIELLKIALIEDDTERAIAALELRAKQEIANAKGSADQIAEQKILIEKNLQKDILGVQQKALEESIEQQERAAKEAADKVFQVNEDAADARQLLFDKEELELLKSYRRKEVSETDFQVRLAEIKLQGLKAQLENLNLTESEEIAIRKQIEKAEIAFAKDQIDREKAQTQKILDERKKRVESIHEAFTQITNVLSQVFAAEKERIERSIALQEERVEKAKAIADSGNAELLQLEENRLTRLQQARERAARKERQIQAAQIAANAALAVSQGIVAVIGGFKTGNVFTGIAKAVALAATVASSIIAIRSALSDVPAFAKGVDQFDGVGTATSDSNIVRLSKGERVTDAKTTSKLMKMGVTNDNVVGVAAAGIAAIDRPVYDQSGFTGPDKSDYVRSNEDLKKEIRRNTDAVKSLGVSATIDHRGFTASIRRRNYIEERRRKHLK